MKKFLITFVAVSCIMISVSVISCFAQGIVPIGPGNGDGTKAPLGGIELLAAAGGGYAIKKLYDRKKQS